MLSARYAPIAVIALLVAGLLAFGPAGNVEADVESHSVDPASVVASGGSVTATLQANANGQDVFIIVTDPVLTTFLDEECLVDASPCTVGGADCDDALLTLLGPGIYCRQYSADQDGVAGADAFSVTLAVTVTCQSTAAFGVEAGNWDDQAFTLPEFASVALECILPGTPGTFLITKAFDGDPTQTFEFTYATGISATCTLAGSPDQALSDGDTFSLAGGESALLFDCGQGDHTVTETPPDPAIASLTAIDCGEDPDVTVDLASASATVRTADSVGNIIGGGTCTFTNTAVVTDTPDIIVMKECVGEFTATFEVTVGEETRPLECGATEVFADLEPGTYTVTETIEGGDEEGFGTTITCDDTGETVEGTSVDVTLEESDVTCVIVNGIDVEDIVCPCLSIEIDLDNTNTNTIGIDNDNTNTNANDNNNENDNENKNENENDNTDTNTQDQENTQDQDNTNEQTNNITSSPEVNIDFD